MAGLAATLQDDTLVRLMRDELRAGRPFALATVLEASGTLPRGAGTRMVVLADGTHAGTVGGGYLERSCVASAKSHLAQKTAALEHYSHQGEGTKCGSGAAIIGISCVGPEKLGLFEDLLDALENRRKVFFLEDWSQPSRPVFELANDPRAVPVALSAGYQGQLFLEDEKFYVESVYAIPRLFIFGAGHVGKALVPVAARVGFVPVVCDCREALATPERLPDAAAILCEDYRSDAPYASITPEDYVVACTHTHATEVEVLQRVLPKKPCYIGCLGSSRKKGYIVERLTELGFSRREIDSVRLPIGTAIKAVTPDEIAISITGELILVRAERAEAAS